MKRSLRKLYNTMVGLFRPRRCTGASLKTMSRTRRSNRQSTEAPLEGVLEKLSLRDAPTVAAEKASKRSLLTLPVEIFDGIIRQLASREVLMLAASCKQLHPFAERAYQELRFVLGRPEHPRTISATVESLQLLLGTLRTRPDYAMTVHSVVLCDPSPDDLPDLNDAMIHWPTWNLLAEQLDIAVAEVLSVTSMLRRFVWSDYAVMQYISAESTVAQLKQLQYLQDVSIYRAWGENPMSGWVAPIPGQSIRVERLSLDCFDSSPWWALPFLRSNNRLRSLDLRYVGEHQDTAWIRELYLTAISWRKLQILNVTCREDDAHAMLGLIQHCAACESWPSLSSISFNPLASRSHPLTLDFMTTLRSFPIRRLHLTVNTFGTYIHGFGPELVGNIFTYLPGLEELVLDHSCNTEFAPLPGTMEEWGRAIRMAPNLGVLTLPTLCVTNGTNTLQSSYSSSDEDTLMEVSTTSSKFDSVSYLPATSTLDHLPPWLQPIYLALSIFAEDLVDIHLRRPGFKELRFIHDVATPNAHYRECRMVRFAQEREIEEGEERYMMQWLGVVGEGREEDEAFFWMPRPLRRSQ